MAGPQKSVPFIPFGGMNQEDSVMNPTIETGGRSAFELGDFRYAQNLRTGSTRSNAYGDGENIKDTLQVDAYKVWDGSEWIDGAPPAGTSTAIGQCEDRWLRKAFIAYYNSSDNHSIVEYNQADRTIYELLQWSGLNFSKTYVSMTRVGPYLTFCGLGNKPRIINIETIHTLKAALAAKFCEYHISFSKWAPVAPLICRAISGFPVAPQLTGFLFQFSYRYIYVGGFRSRWGPISGPVSTLYKSLTLDNIRLLYPGFIHDSENPETPKNHTDQEFYQVVDYIEIGYRTSQVDIWRLAQRVKVNKSGMGNNVFFPFANNVIGASLDPDDFLQDYDEVPLESRACEVIDNRVMFGNNITEHEFVDEPDLVESVEIYSENTVAWANDLSGVFTGLGAAADEDLTLRNKIRKQTFKSRGVYKLAIEFKDETGKKSLAYTSDALTFTIPDSRPSSAFFEPQYALGFAIKTGFVPPEWATNFQILRTNCLNIDYFIFGVCDKFTYLVDDTTTITDSVTTPEEIQAVFREYFDAPDNGDYTLSQRLQNKYRKTKESGTSSNTTELGKASRVFININNWYNAAKNTGSDVNFPLNKLYYEYRQGDRVRFYGSASATPTADQVVIYDLPIVEFTGRGVIIEKPSTLIWLPQRSVETEGNFIIEIYRPKKQVTAQDMLFYEMGEWYPVINATTPSRDFGKRDWRWTNPAAVTSTTVSSHYIYNNLPVFAGDVHTIRRNYYYDYVNGTNDGSMVDVTAPSMNPDKEIVFGRWERGNGRVNTGYTYRPVVEAVESEVRFGSKYLQDAVFNGINNFRPLDRFLYPQEYGAITEMINTTSYQVESVGSILLILASMKSFSVYVNRTTFEDLGGRTNFVLSEKVLGAYNSLLGDNGCINPESISFSEKGNVYWWDQINGSWIRYGRDGNTDIAEEYKMGSWFKEIQALLEPGFAEENEADRPWITSNFDGYQGELIVLMGQTQVAETLRGYTDWRGMVFNEKKNQWKFVHNYYARLFTRVNNELISVVGSALHIHEAGTGYSTFYGTKVPVRIEPVFNKDVLESKQWQAIAEVASHKWGVDRTLSEYRGSRVQQESRLTNLAKLIDKEDTFYSELMRDRNTPNASDPDLAQATGNALRSKTLQILFKLDDSVVTRSLLHQLIVSYIDSPKNP